MTDFDIESTLSYAQSVIGQKLLSYLLGSKRPFENSSSWYASGLDERQEEVVSTLSQIEGSLPAEVDESSATRLYQSLLMQITGTGRSLATHLHEYTSREEFGTYGTNRLERSLAALAIDIFPAYLLPTDVDFPVIPWAPRPNIVVTSTLHRHPKTSELFQEILVHPTFRRFFTENSEHGGISTKTLYRNVGAGSGLQLSMLPELLMSPAWRHSTKSTTAITFTNEVFETLDFFIDVLEGKPRTVPARFSFTGIRLPSSQSMRVAGGLLRETREEDRRLAPDAIREKLRTVDSSDNTVEINYDGDVTLEIDFPYKVATGHVSDEEPWPSAAQWPRQVEHSILALRATLMLAVTRESHVQLIPTWQTVDDPLNAPSWGWSDPRQGAGLIPIQLTDDEFVDWQEWYQRFTAIETSKIELAVTRILRAISERREMSDVLVDSVIAWESIFGTKEGEPTFRVTTCLAKLLADSYEERLALKSRLGKIYALRSKVVHGGGILSARDFPMCQEALSVAVSAVRVLLTERAELLALSDGAERSAALLLS